MPSRRQLEWMFVAVAVSTACAGEQESLIVTHAPIWPASGDCVVDAGQNTGMLSGTLDLSFGTPYMMPAILVNQLAPQQAGNQNSGIDNSEVQLSSADVDLELPQAPDIIGGLSEINDALVDFRVPLATVSIPGGARHGVAVEVVPRATALALAEDVARFQPDTPIVEGAPTVLRLLANVTFNASRTGNTSGRIGTVQSRTFSFPIDVCIGCMIDCSTCPGRTCPENPIWEGFICGNAQDAPLVPAQCMAGWTEDDPESEP
jgi:hypothetical protein